MNAFKKIGKNNIVRHWFGYTKDGHIGVNLELLWKKFPDINKFIKEFSSTYTHEKLHWEIEVILESLFRYREEEIIRTILNERWDKEIQELYKNGKNN